MTKTNYMQKDLIVGIGEVLWDILPNGKKVGGAPANFAFHVSQFGLNGLVVSAVGQDKPGKEILTYFQEKRINYYINELSFPTGSVNVEVDLKGIPHYDIRENVAWDNIPFTSELEEIALRTKVVCFGTLAQRNTVSRNTIRHFIDLLDSSDSYKIYDINLRGKYYDKDVVLSSLTRCNILKINDEELEKMVYLLGLHGKDFKERCMEIMDRYGIEILILTCGVEGSYIFSSSGCSFKATPDVEVSDTVGAGDSFTAAFISGLIKGNSVDEAHGRAVNISAYVCTQKGAMPKLPFKLTE